MCIGHSQFTAPARPVLPRGVRKIEGLARDFHSTSQAGPVRGWVNRRSASNVKENRGLTTPDGKPMVALGTVRSCDRRGARRICYRNWLAEIDSCVAASTRVWCEQLRYVCRSICQAARVTELLLAVLAAGGVAAGKTRRKRRRRRATMSG